MLFKISVLRSRVFFICSQSLRAKSACYLTKGNLKEELWEVDGRKGPLLKTFSKGPMIKEGVWRLTSVESRTKRKSLIVWNAYYNMKKITEGSVRRGSPRHDYNDMWTKLFKSWIAIRKLLYTEETWRDIGIAAVRWSADIFCTLISTNYLKLVDLSILYNSDTMFEQS